MTMLPRAKGSRQSKKRLLFSLFSLIGLLIAMTIFTGCNDNSTGNQQPQQRTMVFTMTNASSGNQVVVYNQNEDGSLSETNRVSTGGLGSGQGKFPRHPLVTQDQMIMGPNGKYLFVTNPGSDEITSFQVTADGINQVNKVSSGGKFPISLDVNGNRLYVLNGLAKTQASPNGGNISGFSIAADGSLSPIQNSTQPLSGAQTPLPGQRVLPAEVQFSPDGSQLIVTEKATSRIDVYPVDANGAAGPPKVQKAQGTTPFGVAFDDNGTLYVTNATTTAPRQPKANGGTISSYSLNGSTLQPISSAIGTEQTATCWIEVTSDNRFAYITSSNSGTVSAIRITNDGSVQFVGSDNGVVANVGSPSETFLLDIGFSGDNLYVLDAGSQQNAKQGDNSSGTILSFRIEDDGSLTELSSTQGNGLPGGSCEGLATATVSQ